MIVAWIEAMEWLKRIPVVSDRKQLVKLLNKYFDGLEMGRDARVFDDPVDRDIKETLVSLMAV